MIKLFNQQHLNLLTSSAPPPYSLIIELSASCNLRCIMCTTGVSSKAETRRTRSMDFLRLDDFVAFMNRIDIHWLQRVLFAGATEPLLNPDIVGILRVLKNQGKKIDIITNGMLLTQEVSKELLGHPGTISISWAGAKKKTFEEIRRGADFDLICQNIKFLTEQKRIHNQAWPKVNIDPLLFRRNIEELPDTLMLAKELGVDHVACNHFVTDIAAIIPEILFFHKEISNQMFQKSATLAKELGISLYLPAPFSQREKCITQEDAPAWSKCRWLWGQANIMLTGIEPCTSISNVDFRLDIFHKPFNEIWNNKWYTDIRSRLLTANPPRVCINCTDPCEKDVNNLSTFYRDNVISDVYDYAQKHPDTLTKDEWNELEEDMEAEQAHRQEGVLSPDHHSFMN